MFIPTDLNILFETISLQNIIILDCYIFYFKLKINKFKLNNTNLIIFRYSIFSGFTQRGETHVSGKVWGSQNTNIALPTKTPLDSSSKVTYRKSRSYNSESPEWNNTA